ncbi:M48 family metalloprotease [Streptomyces sp. NBC_01092]|uniref:M48 family metalloprotease n=1 Tax=Streptomyces sp. NBC_01092 TaxID=2903748 RepID=UPI0038705E79|nr:M48 family metalloprotease [Streptomyces sp. NBC_01092]
MGTTVRFAMLVILLLTASGAMILPVLQAFQSANTLNCNLAAGVDPANIGNGPALVSALSQAVPYIACMAEYAPPPPWWGIAGWPVLLSGAAGVLFLVLPAWKGRRGRLVPLESVDHDGELGRLLDDLAATAGLARTPRAVVDPAAASTGAVVFGRNGRPIVCLHGGLLARRSVEAQRFRAVLLHELAHIANRDVTLTYVTICLWRVFLAMVLVPYLVWEGDVIYGTYFEFGASDWLSGLPATTRGVLLPVVMVALVYLARSDVLHSREVYADLAAVRWGADPKGWAVTEPEPAPTDSALRRAFASFLDVWRTHPRWELRRDVLADLSPLFGIRALSMFLTGTAATLIHSYVLSYLSPYYLAGGWLNQAVFLASAVLVTGVAGIALWRAVVHAALTAGRPPSGVRAGLWLGAGMAAGNLITGFGSGAEWFPSRPQFLLLVVCAGVAYAWWVTQCARLWTRTWRGRTLRPVLLLNLAAGALVLCCWLAWWGQAGAPYASGFSFSAAGVHAALQYDFPGSFTGHPAMLSAITAVLPPVLNALGPPLLPAAVAVFWVVPLLAWAIGPSTATPRWAEGALPDTGVLVQPSGEGLPPLGRVLRAGMVGGVVAWIAVVGVQAYMHTWQPGPQQRGGIFVWSYLAWLFVALVFATVIAAGAAAARSGPHRLLGTLIAAETAALVGLAGLLLLVSSDGCVGPLNTLESGCTWTPAWQLLGSAFLTLVNGTLLLAAVLAVLVAAVGSICRRLRPSPPRRSARTSPPLRNDPRAVRALRIGVSVLCVAAVGIAATDTVRQARQKVRVVTPVAAQRSTQQWGGVADAPVPADTRARQVYAWYRLGGHYLIWHANAHSTYLVTQLRAIAAAKDASMTSLRRVRPTCTNLSNVARWANGSYFRIPDPQARLLWQQFGAQASKGSQDCQKALDEQNLDLFVTAAGELGHARRSATAVKKRVDKVLLDADYAAPRHPDWYFAEPPGAR